MCFGREPALVTRIAELPPMEKRMPVLRDNQGHWLYDKRNQCPGTAIKLNTEMRQNKKNMGKRKSEKEIILGCYDDFWN